MKRKLKRRAVLSLSKGCPTCGGMLGPREATCWICTLTAEKYPTNRQN